MSEVRRREIEGRQWKEGCSGQRGKQEQGQRWSWPLIKAAKKTREKTELFGLSIDGEQGAKSRAKIRSFG